METDNRISFTVELTKSEYHLYTTLCLEQFIRNTLFTGVTFIVLIFIDSFLSENGRTLKFLTAYIFYTAIVIAIIISYKVIRVKASYDKDYSTDKISRLPLTYSFFDDHFLLQNDLGNDKIPLDYIFKVLLNKKGIILLLSTRKSLVIPRRVLDDNTYNKLVEYFTSKLS